MNNRIKFSIITVTYNSEKHLEETLDSVISQKFSGYEHILWDGGSYDRTLEIAGQYPHLKIISGSDKGISDAMNKGAFQASGKYLIHLHSDDCFAHPEVLMQADLLIKQNPDVKWFYGQTQIIDEKSSISKTNAYVPFSLKKLKKYNIISHPATFIERELFLLVGGFKTNLRYCMDYELWLRLSTHSTPIAVPKIWSSFREHNLSLSTSHPLAVAKEAYMVRNQYLNNFWQRWKSYRTFKRRCKKIHLNSL